MLDFDGTRKARRRGALYALAVWLFAFALWAMPAAYQEPIRSLLRSSVLFPFLEAQTQIAQRRGRSVDVGALRAQRDSLAAVVAAQATLAEENRQLRAALALRERLAGSFISADLIRLGVGSAESTFLIDKGAADGVSRGSPVITADGVLGVVWEVDQRTAQAIDWTHPQFRTNAMTDDGSVYGLVEPRRGLYRAQDLLALAGATFQSNVHPGRRVVTSGRGNVFPRGIPIGAVISIEEADTGWRKSYLIRPAVRPEAATHVLVGTGSSSADLADIWQVAAPPDTFADTLRPPPASAAVSRGLD